MQRKDEERKGVKEGEVLKRRGGRSVEEGRRERGVVEEEEEEGGENNESNIFHHFPNQTANAKLKQLLYILHRGIPIPCCSTCMCIG